MEIKGLLERLGIPAAVVVVWTPDKGLRQSTLLQKPKRPKNEDPSNLACGYCGEEGFSSRRSRGQHERQFLKNPKGAKSRVVFTGEQKEFIFSHGELTDREIANHLGIKKRAVTDFRYRNRKNGSLARNVYICPYCGRKGKSAQSNGVHQAYCSKNPNRFYKGEEKPDLPVDPDKITSAVLDSAVDQGPLTGSVADLIFTSSAQLKPKEPTFWEKLQEKIKGPKVPEGFNPKQVFGPGAYIYVAPAKQYGRLTRIEGDRVTALVDGREQVFTLDGARKMFNEMMVRAK